MATKKSIVLAGGCFWCTQAAYENIAGVLDSSVGYVYEDETCSPTYRNVCDGSVRAREAAIIYYQDGMQALSKATEDAGNAELENDGDGCLSQILDIYWRHIDPMDAEGQFADRGYQYSTAIYYTEPAQKIALLESKKKIEQLPEISQQQQKIATEILPLRFFKSGEDNHQHYKQKNPVHYAQYFHGSGRAGFIASFWKS